MAPGRPRSPTEAPRAPRHRGHPTPFVLLLGLGLVLPFEAPLFSVGPLTITTVELALYGVLAAWGLLRLVQAGRAPGGLPGLLTRFNFIPREPVARAVILGLAVTVAAAVAATAGHRVPALKFALRVASGGSLFFAGRDLLRSAADRRLLAGAIVLGAVLSALGAVAETVLPSASGLWHPFRTTTFSVTGLPRPSGPFAYPTIAAMYWEAALPLAIAVPLTSRGGAGRVPGWGGTALALVGVVLLVAATLYSATRTALVVAPLASAVMLALTWRGSRPAVRGATVGTLVVMALFAAATFASPTSGSPLAMRLRWWQDGTWYRVRYTVGAETLTLPTLSMKGIPVTVANTGALVWPATGPNAVHVSYHWEKHDATGAHLEFDGWRSGLPFDVEPGAEVQVLATVRAPVKAGLYRLRWDLVREHVTWFSERGNPTADQTVEVIAETPATTIDQTVPQTAATTATDQTVPQTAAITANQTVKEVAEAPRPASRPRPAGAAVVDASLEELMSHETPTRKQLWLAALRLWRQRPILGVGPDNFRHLYGRVMTGARPDATFDERTHANSLYLETLADLGVAGMVALGLLMFTLGRRAWRAMAARGAAMPLAPLEVAGAVALGTFFAHGLLDYFLPFTPAYGLYWMLLAMTTAPRQAEEVRFPLPLPRSGSADSTR